MLSVHLATDRSMNDTLNRLPLEARLVSAAPAMLEALNTRSVKFRFITRR
jgi:hypothetical protein